MIRPVVRWVGLGVVAVIALVAARMISPGRKELELDVFVLVLGGLGLLVLAAELGRLAPSAEKSLVEQALEPEPPEERPIAGLLRLERELSMASARQFDLHYRLRPVLRDVAVARLEQRGNRPRLRPPGRPGAPRRRALRADRARPRTAEEPAGPRPRGRRARPNHQPSGASLDVDDDFRAERAGREHPRRGRAGRRREARSAGARPARDPRRRSRFARGLPRPREDADREVVRARHGNDVLARAVHARPDARGRDRVVDLQPAALRFRVPAGPDLRQHPAQRRDQPCAAEDPGRAARGDAGAAGDDRGRHPEARAAVHRARDPEPDRVRGHISAARGAARPLHAPDRRWLPVARARVGDARAADRAGRGRGRALPGGQPGERARDAARNRAGARRRVARLLHRRPDRGDADRPRGAGRCEPARVARAAQAVALPRRTGRARLRDARRRQGGCGARARAPALAAGRSSGSSAAARTTSSATCSTACRRRRSSRRKRAPARNDGRRDRQAPRLRLPRRPGTARRARARPARARRAGGAVRALRRPRARTDASRRGQGALGARPRAPAGGADT